MKLSKSCYATALVLFSSFFCINISNAAPDIPILTHDKSDPMYQLYLEWKDKDKPDIIENKGAIIHVSTTGNDEKGDGSSTNPYLTIQKGVDEAKDGDTVLVADGEYGGVTFQERGRITIKSQNGFKNCAIEGFYLRLAEGPIIEGFTISDIDAIALVYAPIVIRDCSIGNIGEWYSDFIMERNTIGGIWGDYGSFIMNNNVIGGIHIYESYRNNFTNCLIQGGITALELTPVILINTTILNSIDMRWGNHSLTVINSILRSGISYSGINTTITISHSAIQGGLSGITPIDDYSDLAIINWLSGNIDVDPLFIDSTNGNFHLSDYSPCIGAGTSDNAPLTDLEGTLRGTPPDMGAYENMLDEPLQRTIQIAEAAINGYIHGYAYTWEDDEYRPISVVDSEAIDPWQGFWIALPNGMRWDGIDLLIPKSANPPANVPPLTVQRAKHYLIAPPLETAETDLNASSLGQQLGNNRYEKTWRIGKWQWDIEGYHNYEGPDPVFNDLMALRPGQGFWFQHINNHPVQIMLEGTKVDPPDGDYVIRLPKNILDVSYTYHMIGNPYWYPIKWSDCKVRIPSANTTGKIAQSGDIKSWNIDLKLEAVDGSIWDTYNKVGIVETGNPELLRAFDLEPPGEYIRLSMIDPIRETRYAFDYRPAGEAEYSWSIELSTTFLTKDVIFSIDNLDNAPEGYSFSLVNDDTGESITVENALNLRQSLSSAAPIRYTLIAKVSTADAQVFVEDESAPDEFGITGILPNPFNPSTTIVFSLDKYSTAKISIYNISGQLVETITEGYFPTGTHAIVWNASGQASGVYFVRIETQNKYDVQKLTLMK